MMDASDRMPNTTFTMIPPVAARSTFPLTEIASYIAAEMATPNDHPSELAILYSPDASPTLFGGALDTAVSVEGVA